MPENKIQEYIPKDERTFGQKTRGFFKNMSSVKQILLWYLIISISGALLLWMPFSHTHAFNEEYGSFGLSFIDALFVSASSFSDTGLSTVGIADTFNFFGQLVTLILLQVGGVGWFTIKIFLLTFILRKATNYNTIADGSAELGTANKNDTLGLVFCAVTISIGASLIGGVIFSLIFYFTGVEGITGYFDALWTGLYHASASINNSGLDIFVGNDSMATMYGETAGINMPWEITIEALTMFLYILGGIGFGIIYDIYKYGKSKKTGQMFQFSIITKLCVIVYFAVAFLGLGLAFLSEGLAILGDSSDAFLSADWAGATASGVLNPALPAIIHDLHDEGAFAYYLENGMNEELKTLIETVIMHDVDYSFVGTTQAFRWWTITFNTFSTRNAGFATMNLAYTQDSTKLIYSLMMFIGSGPGSTAGGLRTTTFGVLIVSLWASMRNKPQPHAFGKGIPVEITKSAYAILLLSLILVAGEVLAITIIETSSGHTNNDFIDNLFVVFSAYGTTGLAIADLSTYHPLSKILLILLMFIGQMGISNTLSQIKTKQIKHQRQYVEEYINLG